MKQEEVFNKIGGIIKELNDQFKYLEADPGKINELELELFVANTHFLADHAEVLRKLNAQANLTKPTEPAVIKSNEKYFEPVVQQPEAESKTSTDEPVPDIDIASAAPGDDYSYIRQEPEIIRHELEIDESWADDEDEVYDEPATPVAHAEPEKPKHEPVNPITHVEPEKPKYDPINLITNVEPEKPKYNLAKPVEQKQQPVKQEQEVVTINQKISAQMGNKIGTELHGPEITDLKKAINLNDKLLYVKDLFNGYSLAYSEAIEILNRFKTFEEAENYLKSNYAVKNNWDSKPDTSGKFYELLRRRYS